MAFDYSTIAFLLLCIAVTINAIFSFWTHLRILRVESYVVRQCGPGVAVSGPELTISPDDIKHLQVNFSVSNPNTHNVINTDDSGDSDIDIDEIELPSTNIQTSTVEDDRLSISDSDDSDFDNQHIESGNSVSSKASDVLTEVVLPTVAEVAEVAEVDYKKMNVASLKELCESRGIAFSKKDRKDDLINHLKHWDDNQ